LNSSLAQLAGDYGEWQTILQKSDPRGTLRVQHFAAKPSGFGHKLSKQELQKK